jgi:hypothetical protein
MQGAPDGRIHRAGLVLAQDVFVQLLVLLGKDDVVLQEGEHPRDGAEALDLGLQLADLRVLPVENVAPHGVPTHPVGKADGVGGGKELLRDEKLGCLAVVTADLIHPKRNRLVLVGVFALDHQHRDAVDEKDDILPRAVVAVVKGPLLGDLVNVLRRVVVIDQDQVALALLLVVEELTPVTQVIDEVPVAVDIAVEMVESPEQSALGVGVAGLNVRSWASRRSSKNRERFLARSAGRASGSKPRRCSASSRDTIVQPMASAYSRILACTVLCSPGVGMGCC